MKRFTIQICDDCLDLKGQMCHCAECAFCRLTMSEVGDLLNTLLIRPVVDGERLPTMGAELERLERAPAPKWATPTPTDAARQKRAEEAEYAVGLLQAFKDYVHRRLDEAGIPTHPDGPHSRSGCRIGDRLDLVLTLALGAEDQKARATPAPAPTVTRERIQTAIAAAGFYHVSNQHFSEGIDVLVSRLGATPESPPVVTRERILEALKDTPAVKYLSVGECIFYRDVDDLAKALADALGAAPEPPKPAVSREAIREALKECAPMYPRWVNDELAERVADRVGAVSMSVSREAILAALDALGVQTSFKFSDYPTCLLIDRRWNADALATALAARLAEPTKGDA